MGKLNTIYAGNFLFNTDNGSIEEYIGIDNDVVIPETICGRAVTRIGKGAFYGCTNLRSISYKGKNYDREHIGELYKAING